MAVNRLIKGLPRSKRTVLFRAVEAILKDNPILARSVKTWRTYEGDPDDLAPPTTDQCPWVRLSVAPRAGKQTFEQFQYIPVVVTIELAVDGFCQDDLLDLWDAVEEALRKGAPYQNTDVGSYLRSIVIAPDGNPAGGVNSRFEVPAIGPGQNPKDPAPTMLVGIGNFVMDAYKPA